MEVENDVQFAHVAEILIKIFHEKMNNLACL